MIFAEGYVIFPVIKSNVPNFPHSTSSPIKWIQSLHTFFGGITKEYPFDKMGKNNI